MNVLYIAIATISLPSMFILSNLFCRGFREARGIAIVLESHPESPWP